MLVAAPRVMLPDLSLLRVWRLTKRQLCDVECLLNGAFAPLTGFLNQADYMSVCEHLRLSNGELWPMPITLDVSEDFAQKTSLGEQIVLADDEQRPLALMRVDSHWTLDKAYEAQQVFGTLDEKHPGVSYLFKEAGDFALGGPLTPLMPILHYDFVDYRHTPAELKQWFRVYGWSRIVAFQTRNPLHRAHYELTRRAAESADAKLLLHPVVGMTKPGDVEQISRVKCYEAMLENYPKHSVMLSLLPMAMRMGGPREALWHALIRKNYGVTHFIVGRDHAGPGLSSDNSPFYPPFAAQSLVLEHADEIGMTIMPFPAIVYVKEKATFLSTTELEPTDTVEDLSGSELRRRLESNLDIPEWYSFPQVINILKAAYPPKLQQGFTVFFTGLSGSGKSTLAKALMAKLLESTSRCVTLLDGDVVRKNLSSELGFSKEDRNTHIRRLGYLASEITKHGGIALCAAIAPYAETRRLVRQEISQQGGFIEIHVSTSLEVCQARDVKGFYKKASLNLISGFTGVDAPYEIPENPELVVDTSTMGVHEAVEAIFSVVRAQGYL